MTPASAFGPGYISIMKRMNLSPSIDAECGAQAAT